MSSRGVCLSATFVYSVKTYKHILKIFKPHNSSFSVPNVMAIFRREPPSLTGASNTVKCRWGRQKIAILDQYLSSSRAVNAATVRCYQHGSDVVVEARRQMFIVLALTLAALTIFWHPLKLKKLIIVININ